jgi:Fe-S-cluster-containing dehydrogenase component
MDEEGREARSGAETEETQPERVSELLEQLRQGKITRRQFVWYAALLGVSAGTAEVLAGCAGLPTPTPVPEMLVEVPASEGYIVVDETECAGCLGCMIACSLAHEGEMNLSLSRIQVMVNPLGRFPNDISIGICRQCVHPLCVQVCQTEPQACYVDTEHGNVRVIDEELCNGCEDCIDACPYMPHSTIWNPEKEVAVKCDLCVNAPYWDGEEPACVTVCPAGAIKFTTEVPTQRGDDGYKVDLYAETAYERGWKK